jgi:multidrug efflux pump subunit AcrB
LATAHKKIVPAFNEQRARLTGVAREDIANTTKRAFDSRTVGLYRESDELIPIVLRANEKERQAIGGLPALQVQPGASVHTVPLGQVTDSFHIEWEDPLIWRRDRRRMIIVQANPLDGITSTE